MEIDKHHRAKTTFTIYHGMHQYERMPLELKKAPITFQRAIDVILSSVTWHLILFYMDHILVTS